MVKVYKRLNFDEKCRTIWKIEWQKRDRFKNKVNSDCLCPVEIATVTDLIHTSYSFTQIYNCSNIIDFLSSMGDFSVSVPQGVLCSFMNIREIMKSIGTIKITLMFQTAKSMLRILLGKYILLFSTKSPVQLSL